MPANGRFRAASAQVWGSRPTFVPVESSSFTQRGRDRGRRRGGRNGAATAIVLGAGRLDSGRGASWCMPTDLSAVPVTQRAAAATAPRSSAAPRLTTRVTSRCLLSFTEDANLYAYVKHLTNATDLYGLQEILMRRLPYMS